MEFVSSFGGGDGLRVEETLGNGYVRLRISEAERRQAKHDIRCVEDAVIELLRNARDAGARNIFVASGRDGDVRCVYVIDDGSGIPASMHERVFDARVTSKLDSVHMDHWGIHGRGMALYSIRQNALDARIVLSKSGIGTSIVASFDVNAVGERADQSSWPTATATAEGTDVRGPKNIARACVEFGLEERGGCKVYYGSTSEIIATMYRRMQPSLLSIEAHAASNDDEIPLVERPALCNDARTLRETASALGIEMSERTAHRIIRGQIVPVQNVCARVLGASPASTTTKVFDDRRSLRLSEQDRMAFRDALEQDFNELAQRYYAIQTEEPRIRVGKGYVQVTFYYSDDL